MANSEGAKSQGSDNGVKPVVSSATELIEKKLGANYKNRTSRTRLTAKSSIPNKDLMGMGGLEAIDEFQTYNTGGYQAPKVKGT